MSYFAYKSKASFHSPSQFARLFVSIPNQLCRISIWVSVWGLVFSYDTSTNCLSLSTNVMTPRWEISIYVGQAFHHWQHYRWPTFGSSNTGRGCLFGWEIIQDGEMDGIVNAFFFAFPLQHYKYFSKWFVRKQFKSRSFSSILICCFLNWNLKWDYG